MRTRVLARAPGLPNVPGPHGAHLGVPCAPFEQALAHPWMSNDSMADYVLTVQDDPAEEKRRSSSTDHHHHLHH